MGYYSFAPQTSLCSCRMLPWASLAHHFADGVCAVKQVVTSSWFLFLVRCYLLYKCYTEAQVVRDRFFYPVVEKILHSRHPLVVRYVRIYECYQFCKRLKERVEFVLGIAFLAVR